MTDTFTLRLRHAESLLSQLEIGVMSAEDRGCVELAVRAELQYCVRHVSFFRLTEYADVAERWTAYKDSRREDV